jgi:predicted alpha/beta hydrolase
MMVDARTLDRPPNGGLASFLSQSGYQVYTLDPRGHGRSGPRASRDVDWSYDHLVGIDIPETILAIKERHPSLPLVLIGHSLCAHGGAAALGQRPDLPVDVLVMFSGNVWLRSFEPSPSRWRLKRSLFLAWRALTEAWGYFPARRLRIGTNDEARSYVAQMVGWTESQRWTDQSGTVDYLAGLPRIKLPVLAINSRGDWLFCRDPCARQFAQAMTAAHLDYWDVSAKTYGGTREPGHMTLVVDSRCRPIWQHMERWIREQLQRQSRN